MLMSDGGLRELIEADELSLHHVLNTTPTLRLRDIPLGELAIQPASIDLHLGEHFVKWEPRVSTLVRYRSKLHEAATYGVTSTMDVKIRSGEHMLACTKEYIKLGPSIAGRIEGKSSAARIGLFIHCASGWVDPGFTGQITFELYNASPHEIEIPSGAPISQLCIYELDQPAEHPYGHSKLGSRYQGQLGATRIRE